MGVYYLENVVEISDYNSTYFKNSAVVGGVYNILCKTTEFTTINLSGCEYEQNYGADGGVIALFN